MCDVLRKFSCAAANSLRPCSGPMIASASAPAPLITALYCQMDASLASISARINAELILVAQHENVLQRFLNALHDLPVILEQLSLITRTLVDTHASQEGLRKLVAAAESFLARRAIAIRLTGQTCSLPLVVKKYLAGGGRRLATLHGLRERTVVTDSLFFALNELRVVLRLCATIARTAYQTTYRGLLGLFREYIDMDRVRGALGSTCMHALRCKSPHPGYPTVIYNWVHDRPRIFPHIIIMKRGLSLTQVLATQFDVTSPAWNVLRRSLHSHDEVHSVNDSWDMRVALPLQAVFMGHSGICRVLHLIGTARPSLRTRSYHVHDNMQWEWLNEDEDAWTDIRVVNLGRELSYSVPIVL